MTPPLILLGSPIVLAILMVASPCWGEPKLLEIALASNIENRNPVRPYSPVVLCEKDKNHDTHLPIVNTKKNNQVVFWNRVMSKSPSTFHHTWHKKTSDGWKRMAHVSLKVRRSSSFRTWSKKTIRPRLHIGEWMIIASTDDTLQNVLCIVRFIIK